MKADIKRVFQGWGIYTTFAILIFMMMMHVFGGAQAFNTDYLNAGVTAPLYFMNLNQNVMFGLIAIVHIISVVDFKTGVSKNVLISGTSRTSYYVSKLLTTCLFTILAYLGQVVIGTVMVTAANGFGGVFSFAWLIDLVAPFLSQLFMLLAMSTVFVMFSFVVRSTAADMCMVGLLMGPVMVIQLIQGINETLGNRLLDFELMFITMRLTGIAYLEAGEVFRILAIGLGWMTVSIFIGLILFKKAEIK